MLYENYKSFGYEINKVSLIKKIIIFFTIPLPFSFDKNFLTFSYIFKKVNLRSKIKDLYYYGKRSIYLYKVLFKIK